MRASATMQEKARAEGRHVGVGVSLLRRGVRVRAGRAGRDRVLLGQLRAAGFVQRFGVGAGQPRRDRHRSHRHRAVRPGPRDHLGPDRLATASASRWRTSRSSTATPPSHPMGVGTFGSRSIAVDGAATSRGHAKDQARRRPRSSPTCWRPRRTTSCSPTARPMWPDHRTSRPRWAEIAKAAYQSHKAPRGWESGLEAHGCFSPGNATWPFGTHLAVVEVDPETGNVDAPQVRRRRRLRECDQPDDRRRPDPRRDRPGDRTGDVRGLDLRRARATA